MLKDALALERLKRVVEDSNFISRKHAKLWLNFKFSTLLSMLNLM